MAEVPQRLEDPTIGEPPEPNQKDRMRDAVDIDGDLDQGTDEDRRLLVDTIGDLLLDLLLNDTPVEC